MDYIEKKKQDKYIAKTQKMQNATAEDGTGSTSSGPIVDGPVGQKQLVNRLNYINFQNGTVDVNFRHPRHKNIISKSASPQPCIGNRLVCLWTDPDGIENIIDTLEFQDLIIANGQKAFSVTSRPVSITKKGICLNLPKTCTEKSYRKMNRHICESLKVELVQNGVYFSGVLIDFSSVSFRIELTATPPQTFQWINPKSKVNIIFKNGYEILFSGESRILRQNDGKLTKDYILEPLNHVIQRFKPKVFRSQRQELSPSPDMIFLHPFTGKTASLKVIDMSGSGFSVEDDRENGLLLAGMVIPSLELDFAGSFKLNCRAQVVYRKEQNDEASRDIIKCVLTFLDMDLEDHRKLMGMLHQADNRNSYICNKINMDSLWKFFFETGFIYPKKYAFIQANKETIKATYEKLYTQNPTIARHFIYQKKGKVLGHMAMLRLYENAWLIHHHAALKTDFIKAGLAVLNQIGRFVYDSHRLYSSHMDYVVCYFRPENQFPANFFGGAAKSINDPKASSLDTFAYSHYRKKTNSKAMLPDSWVLEKTTPKELLELEGYYEQTSGGLMIKALDMESGNGDRYELSEEFKRLGFKRERRLLSLKNKSVLKAVVMVNISDISLNMSDLSNCIKIFVLEPDALPADIFNTTIAMATEKFEQKKIPILIYPVDYVKTEPVHYEKLYNFWVLNIQSSDGYFEHIHNLLNPDIKNS
ncbi:MAG: PilZ domain-containing protein [Deltaproteobacteria bacterium]|nr:PilZ domain-containing protein [Deltaproteobacteria bacterium]